MTVRTQTDSSYLAKGDFVYRQPDTPVFVRAYGPILEDANGYCYLDAEAANGTASLGYDATILREAVQRCEGLPAVPSFCETGVRLDVARHLGSRLEQDTGHFGRVAFELGGAQGIELALKVIRANTRKSQFVVFEGGYHGRSGLTAQLSASHRYRAALGDWRIPVIRLPHPDCEQCRFSQTRSSCAHQCLSFVEGLAERELGGMASGSTPDVAALIIEPIVNVGGMARPDKIYMESIVGMFRDMGALIVVDEVFTGFHRTGPMWGFQHYGFQPDIVVMSKALTNGITPLSCVWARDPLMAADRFPPGTHSATFINSPLALTIASVVLERYEQWPDRDQHLAWLERELAEMVQEIVTTSPLVRSGYASGGVGRLLLHSGVARDIQNIARRIRQNAPLEGVHGLILASTGMAPNVIAFHPPLVLDASWLTLLRRLMRETFREAERILA